jgi:hypothetical protein
MPHRRSSYLMLCPVSLVVVEHRVYEFSFMSSESLFMCRCAVIAVIGNVKFWRGLNAVRVPGNYNRHILTNEHIYYQMKSQSFKRWLDINIQDDKANKPVLMQLDQKLLEQDNDNKEASGVALEAITETNAKAPPESFQWPEGGDNKPRPHDRASADVSVLGDSHKHPFSSPMAGSREDTS